MAEEFIVMFTQIKDYFEKNILQTHNDEPPDRRPEDLAMAALLIEVMIVDGDFSKNEEEVAVKSIENAYLCIIEILNNGFPKAMEKFN